MEKEHIFNVSKSKTVCVLTIGAWVMDYTCHCDRCAWGQSEKPVARHQKNELIVENKILSTGFPAYHRLLVQVLLDTLPFIIASLAIYPMMLHNRIFRLILFNS